MSKHAEQVDDKGVVVEDLKAWVESCLSIKDDAAIVSRMLRLNDVGASLLQKLVHRVVEDHEGTANGRSFKYRLIAIPVLISRYTPINTEEMEFSKMTPYRSLFRSKGLLREQDGLILLANLFSHESLIKAGYSDLYQLANFLQKTATTGLVEGAFELPTSDECGFESAGVFHSVCYMVGVVTWIGDAEPPMFSNQPAADMMGWESAFRGMLKNEFTEGFGDTISFQCGQPAPFYTAFMSGHKQLMRTVLSEFLAGGREVHDGLEVILHTVSDSHQPERCTFKVDVIDQKKATHGTFSFSVNTPDHRMIADVFTSLKTAINESGARITGRAYTGYLHCGGATAYLQ